MVVFSMHPDKSPGPDRMKPGFYQDYWDIVGGHVIDACLKVLNDGVLPAAWNGTHIVLIKVSPRMMTDLRPIALYNVLYKVVAKTLANRLKSILPNIISKSQSAFIPGRLITDNIMIAFEICHHIKRKRLGKSGVVAMKTNMSKAYDILEWNFLQEIMQKLGFHSKWINLIMQCVGTIQYKILHNGTESDPFLPGRGLRQGDPLSPFLFIICAEGLSSTLRNMQERGLIHGCSIARSAPPISHLFFVDDSYFFFKASWRNVTE